MEPDTALIFVMNWKYIRPLKVLLYSLYEKRSLQNCPIIIITDDRKVENDRFVQSVASYIEYMDSESLLEFNKIRGDLIREKSKVHFAPKYTFLKFLIFKNRGFRRHIFIDADMLCLNALDEQLLTRSYDVKAMKEVASSHFPIRDESRNKFDRNTAIERISKAFDPKENAPGIGINSGFMVIEGRALNDAVYDLALTVASTDAFPAEQPATSETFRRIDGCTFLELPIWYNTRRRVLECLGKEFFELHQNEIKLLHYTPGKPWILGSREPDYLDHLWLDWEERSTNWVEDKMR